MTGRSVRAAELPVLHAIIAGAAGRVAGVEREFELHRDGQRIDARTIWPTLDGLGTALDPGDPNARRGPWGGAVTVDGPEVEAATPPVALAPGGTRRALALAAAGAAHLRDALGPDVELRGYSTHVSVEVDDRRVVAVARAVAERFAVPLMLAFDRRTSPGLLVRPRPGRLEVGGEMTAGRQLRVAVALTAALVLLVERSRRRPSRLRRLPPRPRLRIEPARERYGWYVDRQAPGVDVYALGRAASLPSARGPMRAGDLLGDAWEAARPCAEGVLGADDLVLVDRAVQGDDPLPLEQPLDDDGPLDAPTRTVAYGPRPAGALEVSVAAATWWRATLEVRAPEVTRWLVIPGRSLDDVLAAVDAGVLTAELTALLASR